MEPVGVMVEEWGCMFNQILKSFVQLLTRFIKVESKPETDFVDSEQEQNKIILGHQAKLLLENPVFANALKDIEDGYYRMWKNSKPMQSDEREAVWDRLQALQEVRLKITGYVNTMLHEQKLKEEASVIAPQKEI